MIPRLLTPAIALFSFGAALGLATRHAATAPTAMAPASLAASPVAADNPATAAPAAAAPMDETAQDAFPADVRPQAFAAPIEKFQDAPDRSDPGHGARSH